MSKAKGSDKLAAVGAMVDGAVVVAIKPRGRQAAPDPVPDPAEDAGHDPWHAENDGGGEGGHSRHNRLPAGCPVTPLGTQNGIYFYLDEHQQLRDIKSKEHEKGTIESLFGRQPHLCDEYWPRYGAKTDPNTGQPVITGWRPEVAARSLRAACSDRGVWSAQGRIRGAGSHRDEDGSLILHAGDAVRIGGRWSKPGLIGEMVYPANERIPRPAVEQADTSAGRELMRLLGTWRWERPAQTRSHLDGVDARLMLGWIVAAPVCGALVWRPSAWITGGRGTGKSGLQKLIKMLLRRNGLLQAVDATEAYIRQLLKNRTLPVAIDELEAEDDNRKADAIIKLARLASSGGTMGRGGSDHNPHEFTAQSSFLFSSILTPALKPQDKSRLAMLELRPFEPGDKEPVLDPQLIAEMGAQLFRRIVDRWDRLEATLEEYRFWLGQYGHDSRMQMQFGTLLACAHLALDDADPTSEGCEIWARRLDARRLAETIDDEGEGELCCNYIATSQMQAVGGAVPETVAMFVDKATARWTEADKAAGAARRLEMIGLKIGWVGIEKDPDGADVKSFKRYVAGKPGEPGKVLVIAVASSAHRGLDGLLKETRWRGGVWNQAIGRMDGAIKRVKVKIGGRNEWSTCVPIGAFVSGEDDDAGDVAGVGGGS